MRAAIYFTLIGLTLGQICPPPEVLHPCICIEREISIRCIDIEEESFNLKKILDDASPYVNDSFVFNTLYVDHTTIKELEEGTIEHLKFVDITIRDNPQLNYISPWAINASRSVTTGLSLRTNNITNEGANERNVFDLIKGFKELEFVGLQENRISSIPERAFEGLQKLTSITFRVNQISRIGSRAFAGIPGTIGIDLEDNSIPSDGLPEDAFDGIGSLGEVDLTSNPISFLEQASFQTLLDRAARVVVNRICIGCPIKRFQCDERADWICQNEGRYQPKLEGFLCHADSGFEDIWEYCAGRGNGTFH